MKKKKINDTVPYQELPPKPITSRAAYMRKRRAEAAERRAAIKQRSEHIAEAVAATVQTAFSQLAALIEASTLILSSLENRMMELQAQVDRINSTRRAFTPIKTEDGKTFNPGRGAEMIVSDGKLFTAGPEQVPHVIGPDHIARPLMPEPRPTMEIIPPPGHAVKVAESGEIQIVRVAPLFSPEAHCDLEAVFPGPDTPPEELTRLKNAQDEAKRRASQE